MAWYDNPTVAATLGALAGSVFTACVSVFIWQKTKKIKQVDCIINDSSSLLSFSDTIRNELKIIYADEPANSVFLFNMEVFNSGNLAIREQPVSIRLDSNSKIVGYTFKTIPEVGFGEVRELLLQETRLDLIIELLNPRDRVYIELISINNYSSNIDVYMKNANVTSRVYTRRAENAILGILSQEIDPSLASLAMLSNLPFFGGFANSIMTMVLAQQIKKAVRQKK
ncbi:MULTISPECIES: hypothetical protein [Moorena]|uniref:Uncharacterized protein n=1 Tax=Moorena producens 3L TaxID=489825 RepID=F4XSG5_9CYAN|nr:MULTISPECIES: hypothetical protein [Moorena]EGJ32485.1 hypothetical protein LYNGBM3L_17260 [Moorena producens 3L]NEP37204.1 hypothetical protein [Moorena sp. SIO3B2]NEP70267.1 hypothetical protein [Moorena sp. SIO3A5]NEQ11174.1 hypothetical protein [Moorena sp. SIO4E2]NER92216.1 hypothetical protein [Moorena sp. SIO3A2]